MYVFAYGSLLNPASLQGSLPSVDVDACVPSRCRDRVRTLTVAFPNEGSQSDKAYFDEAGVRPPVVLFWDVSVRDGHCVNGICIPVDDAAYAALEARELRYDAHDITSLVEPVDGSTALSGQVVAFVGKPEFTVPEDVARGVVPKSYLDGTVNGATYWDSRSPGFLDEFWVGTEELSARRVVALKRVDHPIARHG